MDLLTDLDFGWRMLSSLFSWSFPSPRNIPPYLFIPSSKVTADDEEETAMASSDYLFYRLADTDRKLLRVKNGRSKSDIVIPDDSKCIGSSHGWLVYIHPRDDDNALFLTNPLITPVPATISLPSFLGTNFIGRLVMSSPPSSTTARDDCIVLMAITRKENMLLFCKMGDKSWKVLCHELAKYYNAMAYSSKEGLFYCLYNYGKIEAWDLRNPNSSPHPICIDTCRTRRHNFPEYEKNLRNKCLVEKYYLVVDSFSGDVLMVSRHSAPIADNGTIIHWTDERWTQISFKTLRFDVYRLNVANRSWDYVECLRGGDGVLFVGLNQPFMLSAQDFPPGVLMPNSIYFTDDVQLYDGLKEDDMGIYRLRDFTVAPLLTSDHDLFNKIRPSPIWFTPNRCYN